MDRNTPCFKLVNPLISKTKALPTKYKTDFTTIHFKISWNCSLTEVNVCLQVHPYI